ncbi:MAG TPA: hypothetical protein VFK09_03560 [Gemmatimonadales bacterium]|nr:hypothetical protein [Gemmatimonadales bacterium]
MIASFGFMHRRRLAPFKAILLLAIGLSGGPGLPVVDAVVYHRAPDLRRLEARFQAAGTRICHADVCTLGRLLPVPRPEGGTGGPLRVATLPFRSLSHAVPAAPPASAATAPQHSRAPPALSA